MGAPLATGQAAAAEPSVSPTASWANRSSGNVSRIYALRPLADRTATPEPGARSTAWEKASPVESELSEKSARRRRLRQHGAALTGADSVAGFRRFDQADGTATDRAHDRTVTDRATGGYSGFGNSGLGRSGFGYSGLGRSGTVRAGYGRADADRWPGDAAG